MISIDRSKAQTIRLFSGDETLVFKQTGGTWHFNDAPLSAKEMLELINALNSWKAEKLFLERRDLGMDHFVVEVEYKDSTQRTAVSNFNMDYEISGAQMFGARKGRVKKEKIDFLYARSTNLESSAIVSSIDIKNILDIVRVLRDE